VNRGKAELERLFEIARRARPPEDLEPMPGYLKSRVLTHWRRPPVQQSTTLVFRLALACATIVMLGTLAWSYEALTQDTDNEVAIANYELRDELRVEVTP
jgi:hypothetical protein